MAKNLISGPLLAPFGPNLAPKIFCRRFHLCWMLQIISRYLFMQFQGKLINLSKMIKNLVSGPILAHLAKIPVTNFSFFFKNLASSITRYYGQQSSCTISEKTNDPILRKLSDGRKDGRTDGRQ